MIKDLLHHVKLALRGFVFRDRDQLLVLFKLVVIFIQLGGIQAFSFLVDSIVARLWLHLLTLVQVFSTIT